jgi:hypothetical protein
MKCYVPGVGPEEEEELRNCKLERFRAKGKIKRHGKNFNPLSKFGCLFKDSTQKIYSVNQKDRTFSYV